MRIAYVFDPLLPQSETDTEQALNTVSALGARGAEVVLFLPRPTIATGASAEAIRDYYRLTRTPQIVFQRSLYRIPSFEAFGVSPSRAIEKTGHAVRTLLNRQLSRFDLVYTRNIPVVIASLAAGHKVAYETYRPWPKQFPAMAPLLSRVMRHRNFLGGVFHSRYTRDIFAGIGIDERRLEVVYNGYRPDLFEPRMSRSQARNKLGWDSTRRLVVYTGRISPGKGLGLVLDAAEAMPDVDFALIGSEGEGEIERRAADLANVRVLPWTAFDEIPPYLFAADVLVIPPSLGPLEKVGNTVLPMKLFLYLAAGRPILAPRSPDTAELLEHGRNAWLIPPDDAEETVRGLKQLLDNRPLAERLGEESRAMADGLTWEARADKLLGFLDARLAEA